MGYVLLFKSAPRWPKLNALARYHAENEWVSREGVTARIYDAMAADLSLG